MKLLSSGCSCVGGSAADGADGGLLAAQHRPNIPSYERVSDLLALHG